MTTEDQAAQEAEALAQAAEAAKHAEPEPISPEALKQQIEKERQERKAANAEAQMFRKKLREYEEKQKAAEEAILAEQGKHKELADARARDLEAMRQELEPLREFKAQHERRQAEEMAKRAAQVDADFASIPEQVRQHIPDDADIRTKEIAVLAYRAASGAKAHTPTSTAPRSASTATTAPPEPTNEELQALGNPRTPAKEKAEIQRKVAAWNAYKAG